MTSTQTSFLWLFLCSLFLFGCSGSSDDTPSGDTHTPPTDQPSDDDPSDPDDPSEPDEPSDPDEPTDPGDPGSPTDPAPPTDPVTLSGQVVNGPLANAAVLIKSSAGDLLAEAETDGEGHYQVTLEHAGPFWVEAQGGLLNGTPYEGELRAHCSNPEGCHVTPFSTVVAELVDNAQLDEVDARTELGNRLGWHGDPFVAEVPEGTAFDIEAVRATLAGGTGVANWVENFVHWFNDENLIEPIGVIIDTTVLDPVFVPDSDCTELSVDSETPHYLAATRAQLVDALTDPDDKAEDGRLVIGITADITVIVDSPDEELVYEGDDDLVLIGWTDDDTRPTLSGGDRGRILIFLTREAQLTLAGLEFRDGYSLNSPRRSFPDSFYGGAVRSRSLEPLIVYDSVFFNNRTNNRSGVGSVATGRGGAIFAEGPLLVAHSHFEHGNAQNYGGALHSAESASVCHSAFLDNEQSAPGHGHNTAKSGGSAISVWGQGGLQVYDTLFENNTARGEYGGALFSRAARVGGPHRPAGEIRVGHSIFRDNHSLDGAATLMSSGIVPDVFGGETIDGGHIRIYDSEFENNTTESGTIMRAVEANIYLFNSRLEGNDGDTPVAMIEASGGQYRGNSFIDNAQPVIEGPLRNLGANSFEGNRNPSLGPEGRIAFYHDGALRLVDPNGSNLETVKNVTYFDASPTWSPDGDQLAYVDGVYGIADLWRIELGSGQVHRLTNNPNVMAESPTWSVQDEIAYVRKVTNVAHTPFLIYVTTPSGGDGNQISGGVAASDHERWPTWSPDGETLMLSVRENVVDGLEDGPPRLYTMSRSGANRDRKGTGLNNAIESVYAPDANAIVYVRDGELVHRALATGDEQTLGAGRSPSWSPDGRWLVFEQDDSLYRLDLDADDPEPILITEGRTPAWSP
ncbi:PD40 domain-containing protein [Marinimicrobium alkaliphilum]|uniref:PD40 domain-containing protein n=1 Tax=Marinimicrobium alkaliphilum TaxID=2202654 RepID=UPI000DBA573F|nr:PD40 domain-containing protein [Marinimicrobium alkaliphilum]